MEVNKNTVSKKSTFFYFKRNFINFKCFIVSLGLFFCGNTQAQNDFDIRFMLDTVDCVQQTACYKVQVRSSNGTAWGLAGQNYRLYYNSALASWQSGTSLLPNTYQNFDLVQDVQNLNADHINGNLSFEADLGFLNYAIDLNNVATGGVTLPADGSWVSTTELCFSLDPSVLNDVGTCFEIVWARDGMTNEYALSFVEISEWVGPNNTTPAVGVVYDDLDPTDGEASCFQTSCIVLVTEYDIRLDFDSIDCINNLACYNVQIRDPNLTGWSLAGQNYRIYYDASLASWQSGVSLLPTSYENFTLQQDLQNLNAVTPSGNLAFENTLSFLNYSMDLIDPGVGGINLPVDGSWLTTSQLCFDVEPILLNDPGTCLEAIWARTGLTDEYATSFVEISEWVAINDTEMANGALYDDLESSDGDASCFPTSCLFDLGDLADTSATTNSGDYQTLLANNGPRHLIIPTLKIGSLIDNELDGAQSNMADGDGADEDGFSFPVTLNISPNNTIQLPLQVNNTSGSTAHYEAWIDWNGDGDFDDTDEMIFDLSDDGAGDFGMSFISIAIPSGAIQNQDLGARFRLSNQDNMTPNGTITSGEVEDYIIQVECPTDTCVPIKLTIKRS
jgi:hypothetical protein